MNLPLITDSHCHLDFPDFDGNLTQIISKAEQAVSVGLLPFVLSLWWAKGRGIAEKFESVLYAAGTHPMNAHKQPMIDVSEL